MNRPTGKSEFYGACGLSPGLESIITMVKIMNYNDSECKQQLQRSRKVDIQNSSKIYTRTEKPETNLLHKLCYILLSYCLVTKFSKVVDVHFEHYDLIKSKWLYHEHSATDFIFEFLDITFSCIS